MGTKHHHEKALPLPPLAESDVIRTQFQIWINYRKGDMDVVSVALKEKLFPLGLHVIVHFLSYFLYCNLYYNTYVPRSSLTRFTPYFSCYIKTSGRHWWVSWFGTRALEKSWTQPCLGVVRGFGTSPRWNACWQLGHAGGRLGINTYDHGIREIPMNDVGKLDLKWDFWIDAYKIMVKNIGKLSGWYLDT